MVCRQKAMKLVGISLAVSVMLGLGLWLFFVNVNWGFARRVSAEEEQKRLSLVQAAEQWLGCKEEDGSHMAIIDRYNSREVLPVDYEVQYTDSWCATFVTVCAMDAELTDAIPPECGCQRQIELFRNLGRWEENDTYLPLPGDIIYYDWDAEGLGDTAGWSDHVGIVIGTYGPYIRVIEGNMNDQVGYRVIDRYDPTIRGYGLPDYS